MRTIGQMLSVSFSSAVDVPRCNTLSCSKKNLEMSHIIKKYYFMYKNVAHGGHVWRYKCIYVVFFTLDVKLTSYFSS